MLEVDYCSRDVRLITIFVIWDKDSDGRCRKKKQERARPVPFHFS